MNDVLNIAAYRFVALTDLPLWRARLTEAAHARGLKGTILLAEEGINLFLAGESSAVRDWLKWLSAQPSPLDEGASCPVASLPVASPPVSPLPFAGLQAKESWSAQVPFRFLRVKIKREIIRMNQPAIAPSVSRAPAVEAHTLVRWLQQGHDDAGREVVMLDTRNRFEVDAGTFEGALDWNLSKFSDFPAALAEHTAALRDKTVVSFCTGGIRCEKAALVMQQSGLPHTYQLEGGILKYFEDTQGAPHWRGRCVVFDDRGALERDLSPQALASPAAAAAPHTSTPPTQPTH